MVQGNINNLVWMRPINIRSSKGGDIFLQLLDKLTYKTRLVTALGKWILVHAKIEDSVEVNLQGI